MIILLDMDGVLCNWVKSACEVLDLPYEKTKRDWKPGAYNLATALDLDRQFIWDELDKAGEAFWSELEPFEWTDDLWEFCESIADTKICTTPSLAPHCHSGKMKWLQKHRTRFYRKYILTPDKAQCAAEDTILVDDKDANIEKFKERGGHGVLFPQPWNKNHGLIGNEIKYVKEQLEVLQGFLSVPLV